ncbi:MAG TPA: HDOD domain-containing protein [Noviherbaspirillum sp.]
MSIVRAKETSTSGKTMTLLWSRVRQRGDLPAFSRVVNAIVGAMHSDDDREFNMTRTVLQDPALTQKVLRLANSAMYAMFEQGINTVSKAVIVLGTQAIGHLALGLKLIDGLQAVSSDSAPARGELEKAVLAGHIARQLVSSISTRDAEEAVVCSILHTLGRMMATFYLSDLWQQVQACCAERGIGEDQAVRDILGLGLDEIGRQVAQQWGLPFSLISTMHDVAPRKTTEPLDHQDWLAAISTLSAHCATALRADDDVCNKALAALARDYAGMLGLEAAQMLRAVDAAQTTAADEHADVVRPLKRVINIEESVLEPLAGKPADAAQILARGMADMRGAASTASIGQLMTMALETVYQGFGFSRAIAFLRNPEQGQYAARMWFGEGVEEIAPRLAFADAYQPDVFHAALAADKIIFVEYALDAAFVNRVPRWWREALPMVRSFMVLPVTVERQAVGFIYGDWDLAKPEAKIEQAEVLLLNELRMLVARVVEQRRPMEASWSGRTS